MSNADLLQKIDTASLAGGGLLNPEQAREFLRMTFEATPFSQLHRKEIRTAKTGEVDKIAIGGRLIRKKIENTDDGYRAGIATSKVQYSTVPIRLPWEITEETIRQNIEGERFEDTVMQMMTTQLGIDLEDLHFNGDTASADPFIQINDGWLKQVRTGTGAHVVDCAGDTGFGKATLFKGLNALPNKYRGPNVRWMMSPTRRVKWLEYLTGRATAAGDAALIGAGDQVNKPLGYAVVEIPSLPDSVILLGDPRNFIVVNTYEIRIRKTTEGREAVMQDKRLYVIHLDDDPIVQELDAVVLLDNVPSALASS